MGHNPPNEIFLSCYKTHWDTSSDALMIVAIEQDSSEVIYANGVCFPDIDFSLPASFHQLFSRSFADKLSVLAVQASKSGSEVRYSDQEHNELVLFPFQHDGQSLALCRVSNLTAMLRNADSVTQVPSSETIEIEPETEVTVSADCKTLTGKVLIADDHPDNRNLLDRILTRMGFDVVQAQNGEEAVEQAIAEDFELIIMDIQMPVLGGEVALQLLQKSGLTSPVIAQSSNATDADISHYIDSGFVAHIAKPINTDVVVELVTKHVQSDKSYDANQIKLSSEEYLALKRQYISHLPADVARLESAFSIENWRLVGKVAHAIKGSSGNFGFERLSELAGQLEDAVDDLDISSAQSYMDEFMQEYKSYQPFSLGV